MSTQEVAADSCLGADQSGLQGSHDPLSQHAPQALTESLAAPELGTLVTDFRQCRAATPMRRNPSSIDVLVMHTPEGGEDATLDVCNGDRAGFDFYLTLDGTLHQCNDFNSFACWHAGEWNTNVRSVGIEQGDYAANSGNFPDEHYDRLAALVAALVSTTGIPLQRATSVGQPGIIAHADVTPAVRTDPGVDFKWDLLFSLVSKHLGQTPPTIDDLEADNPNIRQQLVDWRQLRVQQGADPGDYAAFRQHLLDLGAPDPGEQEFTGFRDQAG